MDFAARLTRVPLAHDPDLGRAAREGVRDLPTALGPLIEGAAGSSPYLARLVGLEADWLARALSAPPEEVIADLVAAAAPAEGEAASTGSRLRALKRRVALLVALADLGGVWRLMEVTGALTAFAEAATRAALAAALAPEIRRGRLPEDGEDAGLVVLAMGKMGAGELNYSSDIDLICLWDDARFSPSDAPEARAAFLRATRAMAATLSKTTAEGYVFRTDLRLRPDPASTPVCLSMTAAERYYEAEGRTWERAAYIKARPVAGAIAAGQTFLDTLAPFVWRRHLDFVALHETQDIRRRIRDHRGLHGEELEGLNVKLGAGGIREIEFFAQTQQLIAGGRDRRLRTRRTVEALRALAEAGWIGAGVAETLADDYAALREVEHRLQMIGDAQTHSLPQTPEGFDRVARLSGEGDTAAWRAALEARLRSVRRITGPFFARPGAPAVEPELGEAAQEIVARWPGYPALRSSRAREIFARLRPGLLSRLAAAARPDEALQNFDRFLAGLPAGVQLFSLFDANPALVDLIGDVAATAPALSRYLSRNAGVLDAVIAGEFFAPWPGVCALTRDLAARIEGPDHEAARDAARAWQKDWHFRVGVHLLRGLIDAETAGQQYSDLAEAVVAALWDCVQAEVARRHGPAPGGGAAVVAMGSLGSGSLAANSDLDLLVIFDAEGAGPSEGPRPLDPRAWYARATKALVAALSAPTAAGTAYAVDMRLRPSGRQGPVATGFAAFERYQREEAWTWEHLALTRARAIAGPRPLRAAIERVRRAILAETGARERVVAETAAMRARLEEAGRTGGTWDVKPGPGGVQDIALCAQAGALIGAEPARGLARQLPAAARAGLLSGQDAAALAAHARVFEAIRQGAALLADRAFDPAEIGEGGRAFLARLAGAPDWETLAGRSDAARAGAAAIVDRALPAGETP